MLAGPRLLEGRTSLWNTECRGSSKRLHTLAVRTVCAHIDVIHGLSHNRPGRQAAPKNYPPLSSFASAIYPLQTGSLPA